MKRIIVAVALLSFVACGNPSTPTGSVSLGAEGVNLARGRPVDLNPGNISWVRFTGGTFNMGSDEGEDDAKPVHLVEVRPYEIAKTETTVAQYRKCVDAYRCREPKKGDGCNWGRPDRDNYPVNCLTYNEAFDFTLWAGCRFPTEAEWEYAARGGGYANKYPWGNQEPTCAHAVIYGKDCDGNSCDGCAKNSSWPVCSKPLGNTEQGLCDMAGNIWEWVDEPYSLSYNSERSANLGHVCRGGGYQSSRETLQTFFRYDSGHSLRKYLRVDEDPASFVQYGFRCARDAQ